MCQFQRLGWLFRHFLSPGNFSGCGTILIGCTWRQCIVHCIIIAPASLALSGIAIMGECMVDNIAWGVCRFFNMPRHNIGQQNCADRQRDKNNRIQLYALYKVRNDESDRLHVCPCVAHLARRVYSSGCCCY